MKLKTLLLSTALATSLLLGSCGNSNHDSDTKKDEKKTESQKSNHTTAEKGMFKGENKETVEGKAMIKDNKLMLTDFKSSKGPDLHVYLTKNGDIKTGKKIDAVKYDEKEQTFDLKGIDVKAYDTVTIYCDKAHVVFGNAKIK